VPYPDRLVNPGESLVLDLRPHWWYFSKHIFTGVPLFLALALVLQIEDSTVETIVSVPFIALAVVWAIWLGLKYFQWARTYFVVSDQRVIYRTGVLSRHGVEIPLDRINNLNFHQGIFERIIGAGDLEVQSAGEEGTTLFENVRHPDGVQQEIYRQMETDAKRDAGRGADAVGEAVAKAVQAGGGPTGGAPSVPDQIEQLARLRDSGRITPAEYERKKGELLDRM
jgi:uncharacterized membrane protein YdbT with pleckstrin-like domain